MIRITDFMGRRTATEADYNTSSKSVVSSVFLPSVFSVTLWFVFFVPVLWFVFFLATPLFAQSGAKIPDPDPELERKTFILPEGFEVNLFAADPLLAKPIQMNFDPQGRLWVACSETYPHIKPGDKANDKIIILEDTKGTGKADKVTVFADGLLIPTGVEPGDGGAYVANSTELLHLSASKPGGKADKMRIVLSGFGTEDTHHILHTLRWGPDGMLYMNQSTYIHSHIETPYGVRRLNGGGVWQFRPETMQLEVFLRGFINPWGHHFDRFGQSFVTDGANGEGITHGVPGFAYSWAIGFNRIHHGLNPGSPKHCGLEILSGSHLPEEWRGNLITNDFRGHRVCRFVVKDDGSTFASREMTELVKSNHEAFRPIDVKMGPDGAIYIADWYNPIIQHGEIDFRDPRRDHTHGRIWRISAKGRPLVKKPDLVGSKTPELLEFLKAPEDWTRHNAKRVLKERGAKEVLPALKEWLTKQADEHDLLEALWVYQSLDTAEPALLATLLNAKDFRIRAAATRVLAAWHERITNAQELLSTGVADDSARVRLEAVRALASLKTARAAEVAMTALDRPTDKVLDYALWLTAKELEPQWMPAFQKGRLDFGGNHRQLMFALESVGSELAAQSIRKLLASDKFRGRELSLFMLLARVGGPEDLGAVLEIPYKAALAPADTERLVDAVELSVRQRKIGPPKETESLTYLLRPKNSRIFQSTARLIGLWKLEQFRQQLNDVASNEERALDDRQAAFEGLASLGGPKSARFFHDQANIKNSLISQRLAATAMTAIDLGASADWAATILSSAKPGDEWLEFYATFLNRKGGAAALAKALDGKKLPPEVAKLGIKAVRSSVQDAPELIAALTQAGDLAAQKRDLTKTELEALVAEVSTKGDAARGEALYRRADMQCLKCHAIGGAGGQVGPDLASIGGSAPVDYLVESILLPNKAVKEGYHAIRVEKQDGKYVSGIKIRETPSELVLRDAEDKEVVIPVKDIAEKKDTRSLMPDGLADGLTRGELVDLVKFLSELGKLGPYSVGKARVVRRWQALQPTKEGMDFIRRSRIAATVENAAAFQWQSAYSKVSGELPLDAAPSAVVWQDTAPLSVIRCQLDVTTAGKVKLKIGSTVGLSLFVAGTPADPQEETILDLKQGTQMLTFAIDRSKRKEPLRVELEDIEGSPARVSVIGGK
jgi:putative heme-binding domain-containing protein